MNLPYLIRRILFRMRGRVVHLKPKGTPRGNVLISFTTLHYLDTRPVILRSHATREQCAQMAQAFLDRGYAVDVIDNDDSRFLPKKKYDYFVDATGRNMDRLSPFLQGCKKIFFIDTCHWKYQNEMEQKRIRAIQEKRGVDVSGVRRLPESHAIELCDTAVTMSGDFAVSTYAYAGKKIVRMPAATTFEFPSPEKKDFDATRRNFIWFGGAGLALKQLDLVLEAFAHMPEYRLTVCGKVGADDPFVKAYEQELYRTKNITTIGWIDPGSDAFKKVCAESLGVVYPSISEGCAGSVILCMNAGLIPIVSRESGVPTGDFGVTLPENSAENIVEHVRKLSALSAEELKSKAMHAWQYARDHHSRDAFAKAFAAFVDSLEKNKK